LHRSLADSARVEQDDWNRPELSAWLARLEEDVKARPGAILVAHSLGCVLVAHLAVQRPELHIGAALLVAPADVESCRDTLRTTQSFAPIPRRELPFRAAVIASTNDPFMTRDRAFELAQAWKAQFIDAGARGHINVASGFGRWSAIEDVVRSLAIGAVAPDLHGDSVDLQVA
jgi:predicted alpha/beta hydrolase family esterase